MSIDDLKKFIKEELGRNLYTPGATSLTFQDYDEYDIQIDGSTEEGYFLTIFYDEDKIFPRSRFNDREEAVSFSRQVVDNDRVNRMNKA
jgi:hypothetical protein